MSNENQQENNVQVNNAQTNNTQVNNNLHSINENNIDVPDNSVMDMGNLLRSLFTQATNLESRHKQESKHNESECESQTSESSIYDEEYRWETLGNLIESHKKLCKAFLMLLKERDVDE